MPQVPGSLAELVSLFAGCFTQPTFRTFRALLVGFIARVGEHTITGCLVAGGVAGGWHHSRGHRFFSRARWSPDRVGLVLLDVIVARLIDPGAPLLIAIDDTLLRRSGPRVWGTAWHREPAGVAPRRFAWGNNWVVAAIVVRLSFLARPVALPVLFRLQAKRQDSKHELAAQLIALIARRYKDRRVDVVADGHYTGPTLVCQPNVTLITRLRANAALHGLMPPRTGKRGRPRAMGARLPSLAQIASDPATPWETVQVHRYGQTATVQIHRLSCLWYRSHRDRPMTMLLVRDPSGTEPYELALISTDLDASAVELVERFACRWSIEVAFEDAKQLVGVGEARNRTELAVKRTVPFGLLCMSLTVIWYALYGHSPTDVAEHRARAPWYRTKTNPSTADMLAKLRRTIIAAQYSPGRLRSPYREKINAIQQAWAAALP
ncbi:MAG TPA: transposase [Solirubrobacteraceae bacterium]|nr:transposase [Solirubrobacteraceae bacterium]